MIDHSKCDHERTSRARAICRRGGDAKAPRKKMGATPREPKDEDSYGQTPRDRYMECDKCGVERIAYRGTDPLTGILQFVGEKCLWYIKRAPDLTPLD